MLSEIRLIEVSTSNIHFKHTPLKSGTNRGNFEAEIGEITVEAGKKLKSDEALSIIEITASPKVVGLSTTSDGAIHETFNLQFGLRLVFTYPDSIYLTPELLDENRWFFEYNVKIFFKTQCEQILKPTTIKNIELPFG